MSNKIQIIEELTLEDISNITVHTTISSLRRVLAIKSYFIQPKSENVPQLYYITENDDNSIHALASDLTRFLLLKSTNNISNL